MFRRLEPIHDTLADIARIEALVRARFRVPDAEIVLVSQDVGTKPGFPPLETNILFWKDEKRYRLKIFKPVAEVSEADLPIAWLLPALEDTGENGCC
jgi:nitrate reductase delta subunit